MDYDAFSLYEVSYDGAIESYQLTIEYMWVYKYPNFKTRFTVPFNLSSSFLKGTERPEITCKFIKNVVASNFVILL